VNDVRIPGDKLYDVHQMAKWLAQMSKFDRSLHERCLDRCTVNELADVR
jgi:hypothetical protein